MNRVGLRRHAVMVAGVVMLASATTVLLGSPPAVAAVPDVAYAYGFNDFGQLGNITDRSGATTNPVAVTDLATNVAQLATDGVSSAAVHSDGTVWTWGSNGYGMLGDGSSAASRHVPGQVPGLPAIAQVSMQGAHAMAVGVDGSLWAWGRNVGGELGDGKTESQEPYAATPVRVAYAAKVAQAAAGGTFSVALNTKGEVFTWGKNDTGQLGNGTLADSALPARNRAPYGIAQVTAGSAFAMAVRTVELGGAVWGWGANGAGQLGVPTATAFSADGVRVGGQVLAGISQIAAGDLHGLALQSDGSLWSWGDNRQGQLGDGTITSRYAPAKLAGLTPPTRIAAGRGISAGIAATGALLAWGGLPPGPGARTARPAQIAGPKGVTQLGVGGANILMRMPQQPLALPRPTSDLSVVTPPEGPAVNNRPGTWTAMPGLSTTVTTAPGANLAATVSAEIFTTGTVWLRVLVDGQPTSPGDVVFRFPGAQYDGTRSFTFGLEGLTAGKHVVQVEWFSEAGQPAAKVRDRTLSVNSEAAGDGRVAHVAAESDFIVKSTESWEDVPSLSRTVSTAATGNLKVTFSGQTTTGTGQFFARALIDGQPTEDVLFEEHGVTGGARSYVFVRKGVAAGSHTVSVQWHAEGGTIKLGDRALTVFAAPETTAGGGLATSVMQGTPVTVTATSFIDLPGAATSFTTTAPSVDADVTIGMEHKADHDRTFLRALIDGQPAGQQDVELSTNVNRWHAQTYSFVAKNIRPGTHSVRIQIAVDAGATATVDDRTLAVAFKRRNGNDFAQPYTTPAMTQVLLTPRIGAVPTVAICFDPRRPEHPKPSAAYLRGFHTGTDGGINVQDWYRENTGNQFGMAPPTYIGCDDAGWLSPPAGRTGDWYWQHGEFQLMLHDAMTAADPFFDFKSFDHNNDGTLTGDELVIEVIRPQNTPDGTNLGASATLDGVSMNAVVLDLYMSSHTDTATRLTNVGLLAHEGAHRILDAADMYWANDLRPGYFSVMDQHFNANHFDGFHKLKSGFVTPGVVEINGWTTRTVPLAAVETQREITIVYDPARGDKEYFILENRWGGDGAGNFDANLPTHGLAIWHIVQDQTIMDQFPPPFTGDKPPAGEWGRLGIRLLGVLNAPTQNRVLTYADGTAAGIRITAMEGPQEFLDVEIARV